MKRLFSIWLLFTLLSFGIKAQQIQLDTLVDLKFQGITLKQALHEISRQYGIRFSYSDSKIPTDNVIHADYTSIILGNLLTDMLQKNGISYSIIENQIVLFPFNTNQTITVRGKVIDELNGSPIPFAHISLSGTFKGTSSNEDGEFEISLTKLPSELLISHLSHEKKLIYVYNEAQELEINLAPSQMTLQEVTIKAKRNNNAIYQLVKKAYDRLSKSELDMKYGKAFYRQKSQREERYTEIFELFYDVKYTDTGIKDWAVQEGRYAFQNGNEYDIFLYNKNFTLLSRLFSIRQPATESYLIPVNQDVKKLFDLELKEVIKFDERLIGVISYKPKSIVNLPATTGELYIDIDNYQILKMEGAFTDASLKIIGLSDKNSAWDNYQLDFQISFIDDHSDQLLMDYIRINHSFDYYFKKELVGKINTSSLLTFYEHYTPVKNKKPGGAINYKTSDMEVIDGVGYNADFWSKNPIVKRTPLEEKLIRDFEQNEAFGVVFLNNDEEVVLLPDKKNNENVQQIISRHETNYLDNQDQCLFLQLDKNQYVQDNHLRFTAYVLDRWTLKPYALGSVLTIEIYDSNNQLVLNKKFDINDGNAYGELELSDIPLPGIYHMKAFTNIQNGQSFEKDINISFKQLSPSNSPVAIEDVKDNELIYDFHPESGVILQGFKSKIVFSVRTPGGQPVIADWQIVDTLGTILQTAKSNQLGIGAFEFTAGKENRYFLKSTHPDSEHKRMMPKAEDSGFSIKIAKDKVRSIQVELHQKPALPKEIYLLSTAGGKVSSVYEKRIHGSETTFDLPVQHLPGGVNTLIVMDQAGEVLGQRTFFVNPDKLTIQLESASWKSKRSNRVELKFIISDQNGRPVNAKLSAVCSATDQSDCEHCDIRNYLYFGEHAALKDIDLNLENDSILSLIDDILITFDATENDFQHSVKSEVKENEFSSNLAMKNRLEEPVIAEVNISGGFSSGTVSTSGKLPKHNNKHESENQVYWIPALEIDEHGIATINYRIKNKSENIYVNIQGLSGDGLVGYQNFSVDPHRIKTRKK